MRTIVSLITLLHLLIGGSALAQDTLSCKTKIIDVGMKMEDVRHYCGKPDYSNVEDYAVHQGNRITGTTPVATWHYNQPGGLLIAVLKFDQDELKSIEYIDKFDE